MSKEEIIEIIDDLLEKNHLEKLKNRAEAYGISLDSNYAISIRDSMNFTRGQLDSLVSLKKIILEKIIEKEESEK